MPNRKYFHDFLCSRRGKAHMTRLLSQMDAGSLLGMCAVSTCIMWGYTRASASLRAIASCCCLCITMRCFCTYCFTGVHTGQLWFTHFW